MALRDAADLRQDSHIIAIVADPRQRRTRPQAPGTWHNGVDNSALVDAAKTEALYSLYGQQQRQRSLRCSFVGILVGASNPALCLALQA